MLISKESYAKTNSSSPRGVYGYREQRRNEAKKTPGYSRIFGMLHTIPTIQEVFLSGGRLRKKEIHINSHKEYCSRLGSYLYLSA